MKKLTFLFTSLLFILLFLTACSSGDSEKAEHSWRAASHVPEDHPNSQALEEISERVYEESEGRIDIKVHPANQLGDYSVVYEEIGKGTIEMGSISTPSQLDKNLELVFMSYLVKDYDEVQDVYRKDSELFDFLYDKHQDLDVKLLGFHAEGFGGIGTINEIDNLKPGEDKGLEIRVPQQKVFELPMGELGFNTTSIPYEDLYTSMQTGAADGWSGGGLTPNYTEFRDVIKYFYQTNDFFDASSIMISQQIWEDLNEEDQDMIQDIVNDVAKESIEVAEENEEEYREKLEDEGVKYIELSDEEIEDYSNYVHENVWPELEDQFDDNILDKLSEQ